MKGFSVRRLGCGCYGVGFEPRNSLDQTRECCNGYSVSSIFFRTMAKTGNHGWLTIHPARFFLSFVEALSPSPPLCSSPFARTAVREAILTTAWRVSVLAVTSASRAASSPFSGISCPLPPRVTVSLSHKARGIYLKRTIKAVLNSRRGVLRRLHDDPPRSAISKRSAARRSSLFTFQPPWSLYSLGDATRRDMAG